MRLATSCWAEQGSLVLAGEPQHLRLETRELIQILAPGGANGRRLFASYHRKLYLDRGREQQLEPYRCELERLGKLTPTALR